ncbi:hypothetical protein H0H93_001781, partial [Arthromyces matolae]
LLVREGCQKLFLSPCIAPSLLPLLALVSFAHSSSNICWPCPVLPDVQWTPPDLMKKRKRMSITKARRVVTASIDQALTRSVLPFYQWDLAPYRPLSHRRPKEA